MSARSLLAAAAAAAVALTAAPQASAQDSAVGSRCIGGTIQRTEDLWGPLPSMAGRYYWFEDPKLKSHSAYMFVHWVTEGQVLAGVVFYNKHVLAADEYVLNPAAGRLLFAGNQSNVQYWGTARPAGPCMALYVFVQDHPVRTLFAPNDDGSFTVHADSYKGGAWQSDGDDQYIPTTIEELKAAGLVKGR